MFYLKIVIHWEKRNILTKKKKKLAKLILCLYNSFLKMRPRLRTTNTSVPNHPSPGLAPMHAFIIFL